MINKEIGYTEMEALRNRDLEAMAVFNGMEITIFDRDGSAVESWLIHDIHNGYSTELEVTLTAVDINGMANTLTVGIDGFIEGIHDSIVDGYTFGYQVEG